MPIPRLPLLRLRCFASCRQPAPCRSCYTAAISTPTHRSRYTPILATSGLLKRVGGGLTLQLYRISVGSLLRRKPLALYIRHSFTRRSRGVCDYEAGVCVLSISDDYCVRLQCYHRSMLEGIRGTCNEDGIECHEVRGLKGSSQLSVPPY